MKDALIRMGRTFLQTAIGVYLAGILGGQVAGLSDLANVGLLDAAAAAGLVAVLSFAQNWLEESRNVTYDRG